MLFPMGMSGLLEAREMAAQRASIALRQKQSKLVERLQKKNSQNSLFTD
jgi:hypothetical protein